jgi:hypothetical protein
LLGGHSRIGCARFVRDCHRDRPFVIHPGRLEPKLLAQLCIELINADKCRFYGCGIFCQQAEHKILGRKGGLRVCTIDGCR